MTSASYGREVEWTPLPDKQRKWEHTSNTDESPVYYRNETASRLHEVTATENDFASAASYEDHPGVGQRPEAPRLREYHVWGVREDH